MYGKKNCGDRDQTGNFTTCAFRHSHQLSTQPFHHLVNVWSASGTYPHDDPIDNRPRPQSTWPAAITRGDQHGRDRLRKHRIPLLALPAPGPRPLPAPTKLRRRLESPVPITLRYRHPKDPYHRCCPIRLLQSPLGFALDYSLGRGIGCWRHDGHSFRL